MGLIMPHIFFAGHREKSPLEKRAMGGEKPPVSPFAKGGGSKRIALFAKKGRMVPPFGKGGLGGFLSLPKGATR